jgi:hypothetical protein
VWPCAREDIERVIVVHFPQFLKSPELFDTLFTAMDSNADGVINYRV